MNISVILSAVEKLGISILKHFDCAQFDRLEHSTFFE